MKHVLSIAGSDCSGGAGIQADLKAFGACGVYGMSVITALTAQNTVGVQAVQVIEPDFVKKQLESIFEDIRVDAVKIGMLPNPGIMAVVAGLLPLYQPRWIVVDPVMIAKSGHALMAPDAIEAFKHYILPLADVLTPNLPEVEALVGSLPKSIRDMEEAGQKLRNLGARSVLVKGGHLAGKPDDLLVSELGISLFEGERFDVRHSHGTGCSLSSSLAAFLARGLNLEQAVKWAKDYVEQGIRKAFDVGKGISPINHFWNFWDNEGAEQ